MRRAHSENHRVRPPPPRWCCYAPLSIASLRSCRHICPLASQWQVHFRSTAAYPERPLLRRRSLFGNGWDGSGSLRAWMRRSHWRPNSTRYLGPVRGRQGVAHLVVGMRGPKFDCRKLAHIRTALGDFEGGFAHDGADVYARAHESRDTIEHLQVDDHWPGAHQPLLISWLPLHSPWRTGRCTAGRARYSRTHRASSVLLKRRRCRRCSSIRSTVCAPLLLLDCNATDPATPECVGSTRVAASACEAREPARHVTGRARLAAGGPNGLARRCRVCSAGTRLYARQLPLHYLCPRGKCCRHLRILAG